MNTYLSGRRVVVTGVGMITALGHNACDNWTELVEGRSGIRRISLFDPAGYGSQVAGEVPEFDPAQYMDRKEARRADRVTQFAFVAADEALKQARYDVADNGTDMAVIIGTAIGGITTLSQEYETLMAKGPGRVSPFLMPMMLSDMTSGQLSIKLGAKGVNYALISACASGADSIGEAANIIRRGDAEIALAGGTEAAITPICMAGFSAAKALTTNNDDPARSSRPFDKTRDGFVMAEGAGVLVIESEEHALKRGATILAELAGYGATSDAFHITQPAEDGAGAVRAMRKALAEARLQPDDIDYMNAHGTSTPMNDKLETLAIKKVFAEYAYELPVSSTKSMTGHLLGAAGAVEAGICVMALQHQVIPPTANYVTPDPECDLDYVPNTARSAQLEAVMTNSLGFGGHNASLVFRKYRPAQ
ncbi:MAG: beta-ketoacyl-ACP synthase II [Chloroflexi bacterium]|jgi:3-oxoacyl-[acyl-carrier-protein] synthase II|nr:beta-ketoacyl-ACP synthase II [Dehalococcoidia bacterium]MCO5201038.1 beta-ketoacyl-ACP synthase II [Chloroflexota bacterium]NJD64839.1 beta-ketoacyl-ACP synthase II [Chloroflexota bacterium]PWB48176.1 MAG: beta-ketoacyl-[acyl-carrier-protein] synthase II [Dehalococcoidia bacterium]